MPQCIKINAKSSLDFSEIVLAHWSEGVFARANSGAISYRYSVSKFHDQHMYLLIISSRSILYLSSAAKLRFPEYQSSASAHFLPFRIAAFMFYSFLCILKHSSSLGKCCLILSSCSILRFSK